MYLCSVVIFFSFLVDVIWVDFGLISYS
ncbi:hypothetical protein M6B38_160335 [Iris pallida]|uniref:Uncharacterized protein n=1 Tax=Iris pallida TaxID=29817 RepID=A0AAX6EZ84_IRIPA|nr:hypothetical protein M6B38_160330 [Iris pallida]KAJ6809364.1 hypothetical protein M6B38_160335 [Iris pallida]